MGNSKIIGMLLILMFSCTTPRYAGVYQRTFIDQLINKPDSIQLIIDKGKYFNLKARQNQLNNDTLKSYIPYIKELSKGGYKITHLSSWVFDDWNQDLNLYFKEIQIKGISNDLYLNFIFILNNDHFTLHGLRRGKMTDHDIMHLKDLIDDSAG